MFVTKNIINGGVLIRARGGGGGGVGGGGGRGRRGFSSKKIKRGRTSIRDLRVIENFIFCAVITSIVLIFDNCEFATISPCLNSSKKKFLKMQVLLLCNIW